MNSLWLSLHCASTVPCRDLHLCVVPQLSCCTLPGAQSGNLDFPLDPFLLLNHHSQVGPEDAPSLCLSQPAMSSLHCHPLYQHIVGDAFRWSSFIFWPCHAACGILVPWPGMEPAPPALEGQSLKHWTPREVPASFYSSPVFFSTQQSGICYKANVILVVSTLMGFYCSQDRIKRQLCTWLRKLFLTHMTLHPTANFVICSYSPTLPTSLLLTFYLQCICWLRV